MYKPIWLRIVTLLSLVFIISCGSPAPKTATPVSDEELNAAIDQAQDTLGTILQAFLAPKETYDFLGVKVRFRTQEGTYDDNWVELDQVFGRHLHQKKNVF